MGSIPFSVYDFFGYLASGLVVVAAADFAFHGGSGLSGSLGLPAGLLWIVIVYVIGHIVSAFSSLLMEDGLVRRFLGPSEVVLFRDKPNTKRGKLFPGYYRPLPLETRQHVKDRAGIDEPGRGLFLLCWGRVMGNAQLAERLNTFLNLYGFSRNTSMAAAIASVILFASVIINRQLGPTYTLPRLGWGVAALFASAALLYRYLKFFRHYTLQVFVLFAGMP
jgi:hypothetical protein